MLSRIPKKIKTVSDFQRKTKPTFDEISSSNDPVLILNRSEPIGVFLNINLYNAIANLLENLVDSKDLDEAINNSKDKKYYTLEEVKEMLMKR